eukprot:TRINITY_DN48639_c0_g1_i1.p1 TRINITY_DN48639_c0_g1~~TRINITY_DN48639_c0_g1_i1.p1  ORF type:complete len:661 (-),score=139.49 TRINITY_DN48639_c0_g1_i1:10-1992(-)
MRNPKSVTQKRRSAVCGGQLAGLVVMLASLLSDLPRSATAAAAAAAGRRAPAKRSSSSAPQACSRRGDPLACAGERAAAAIAAYQQGQLRSAKSGLARASSIFGDSEPTLLYNQALVHAADGELDLAIDLLRKALTLPVAKVDFDGDSASESSRRDSREESLVKLLEYCTRDGRLDLARRELERHVAQGVISEPARAAWLKVILAWQGDGGNGSSIETASPSELDVFERMSLWEHVRCCGAEAERRLDHKDELARVLRNPGVEAKKIFQAPLHPESYVIPDDHAALMAAIDATPAEAGRSWMLKPAHMADGHGVRRVLGSDLRGILSSGGVSSAQLRLGGKTIVQRYVENPLLWEGKKFDLRLYVLVTSHRPLRLFLYGDGYARLAPLNFTLARGRSSDGRGSDKNSTSDHDRRVHVTNRSRNQKSTGLCARTLDELRSALFGGGDAGSASWEKLWQRIGDLLKMAFVVALAKGAQPSGLCGKVYGADVIIDDELNPHLLEINRAPAVDSGAGCPGIHAVHSRLAEDVLDKLLPRYGVVSRASAAQLRRQRSLADALLEHPAIGGRGDRGELLALLPAVLAEKDVLLGKAGRWEVLFPRPTWKDLVAVLDASSTAAEAGRATEVAAILFGVGSAQKLNHRAWAWSSCKRLNSIFCFLSKG